MEYIRLYDTVSEFSGDYKMSSSNYAEPWLSYVKENGGTAFNIKPLVEIVLKTGEVLSSYDEEGVGITEITSRALQEPGWNRTAQAAGFKTQKLLYAWIEDNWNDDDNHVVEDFLDRYFHDSAEMLSAEKTLNDMDARYFQGSSTYGPISVLRIGEGVEAITGVFSGIFEPSKIVLPSTFNNVYFIPDVADGLEKLILKTSTPPSTPHDHILGNIKDELIIIVPKGSRSDYVADTKWGELAQHIVEVAMPD